MIRNHKLYIFAVSYNVTNYSDDKYGRRTPSTTEYNLFMKVIARSADIARCAIEDHCRVYDDLIIKLHEQEDCPMMVLTYPY